MQVIGPLGMRLLKACWNRRGQIRLVLWEPGAEGSYRRPQGALESRMLCVTSDVQSSPKDVDITKYKHLPMYAVILNPAVAPEGN